MELGPGRYPVSTCLDNIIAIGPNVHRDHVLCVKLYHVEGGVFPHKSCYRAGIEVDPNVLTVFHALDYLNIFRMSVSVKTKSHDILIPVHDPPVPVPPGMNAFPQSRQVSYQYCLPVHFLDPV
jgi:hypothetical protein